MNFLMSYNMKVIIKLQKPFNDDSYTAIETPLLIQGRSLVDTAMLTVKDHYWYRLTRWPPAGGNYIPSTKCRNDNRQALQRRSTIREHIKQQGMQGKITWLANADRGP